MGKSKNNKLNVYTCINCDQDYTSVNSNGLYCSKNCEDEYDGIPVEPWGDDNGFNDIKIE